MPTTPRCASAGRCTAATRCRSGCSVPNCSSGRAVTTVPERWTGSWAENLALARMADEAGIDFLLPIGRWKGYGGNTDYQGETLETINWASGLLASTQAHHGVRHRACAAVQSDHRGQEDGHRRSHRGRALRPQHRGRLERGRVRDVRRRAARARGALRLSRRNGSTPSSSPGRTARISISTASSSSSKASAPSRSPTAARGR